MPRWPFRQARLITICLSLAFCPCTQAELTNPGGIFQPASIEAQHIPPTSQLGEGNNAIPPDLKLKMLNSTWHPGCPVALDELVYLHIPYFGFDNKPHVGELIVNHLVSEDITAIFQQLYQQHFPIQQMILVEHFNTGPNATDKFKNTIGFDCRRMTGNKQHYSRHSFGTAIDINPMQNPYVSGKFMVPKTAGLFLNRQHQQLGMIMANSAVVKLFLQHGWVWGGNWHIPKDYMHFEKEIKSD